jgi:type II restriction enzyme
MELGRGTWGDDPKDLIGLRNAFIEHTNNYERIFTLRALKRAPQWHYELVEIPKRLLLRARTGRLEMRMASRQFPKPGYCFVSDKDGEAMFQLYFDGGSERKLQIKGLLKKHCTVHATWKFTIPEE